MKTRIRLKIIVSASALAFGLTAGTAMAANGNKTLGDRGTIESVDAQDQTLTIKEAKSQQLQTFAWDQDTKFLERRHLLGRSKPVSADELAQGEAVKIHYQKDNDRLVARTIVIPHPNQAAANEHPQS